jgi:hypothetical protein
MNPVNIGFVILHDYVLSKIHAYAAGVLVVKGSEVQKAFRGKPIRLPEQANGCRDQMTLAPRVQESNQ